MMPYVDPKDFLVLSKEEIIQRVNYFSEFLDQNIPNREGCFPIYHTQNSYHNKAEFNFYLKPLILDLDKKQPPELEVRLVLDQFNPIKINQRSYFAPSIEVASESNDVKLNELLTMVNTVLKEASQRYNVNGEASLDIKCTNHLP